MKSWDESQQALYAKKVEQLLSLTGNLKEQFGTQTFQELISRIDPWAKEGTYEPFDSAILQTARLGKLSNEAAGQNELLAWARINAAFRGWLGSTVNFTRSTAIPLLSKLRSSGLDLIEETTVNLDLLATDYFAVDKPSIFESMSNASQLEIIAIITRASNAVREASEALKAISLLPQTWSAPETRTGRKEHVRDAEILHQFALFWELVTGHRPGKSDTGLFARYCVGAYVMLHLSDVIDESEEALEKRIASKIRNGKHLQSPEIGTD